MNNDIIIDNKELSKTILATNEQHKLKQEEPFCVACFAVKQFGYSTLVHDCANPPKRQKPPPVNRW